MYKSFSLNSYIASTSRTNLAEPKPEPKNEQSKPYVATESTTKPQQPQIVRLSTETSSRPKILSLNSSSGQLYTPVKNTEAQGQGDSQASSTAKATSIRTSVTNPGHSNQGGVTLGRNTYISLNRTNPNLASSINNNTNSNSSNTASKTVNSSSNTAGTSEANPSNNNSINNNTNTNNHSYNYSSGFSSLRSSFGNISSNNNNNNNNNNSSNNSSSINNNSSSINNNSSSISNSNDGANKNTVNNNSTNASIPAGYTAYNSPYTYQSHSTINRTSTTTPIKQDSNTAVNTSSTPPTNNNNTNNINNNNTNNNNNNNNNNTNNTNNSNNTNNTTVINNSPATNSYKAGTLPSWFLNSGVNATPIRRTYTIDSDNKKSNESAKQQASPEGSLNQSQDIGNRGNNLNHSQQLGNRGRSTSIAQSHASLAPEQNLIFTEFKIKYDELKQNYDKLRTEFDDVTREKKKLEIKFLNANPEYYEKQIKRLRAEVEKYQEENEDHKYKYLQAENGKKQFEAGFKVKQEELKTMIKQLEKEKISNVELKHQNEEKEKLFARIRVEFEKSNEAALRNYDEVTTKFNKLDGMYKTRNSEHQQLKHQTERIQRRLSQTKDQYKKYKQNNEEKLKNLTKNLQLKTTEYFKYRSDTTSKIQELTDQIQRYKSERVSAELLANRKSEEVNVIRSNRQLELDVVRLEERIRILEYDLVQKDEMIIELQKTIDKIKLEDQVKQLQAKITQLNEQKIDIAREHEKVKGELIKQIDQLRIQLMQAPERIFHSPQSHNFQEILKIQLEENAKLKKQLSLKIDEVYNLKSDIDELKVEKQNILSEMDVLKKIKKSEQKNIKIQAEIASQYVKNDMESYKRKIEQLETKLNSKIKQVKDKDTFIMNSVLGRSKPEQTTLILSDFQRIFEANYVEKLAQANKRIQDLLSKK